MNTYDPGQSSGRTSWNCMREMIFFMFPCVDYSLACPTPRGQVVRHSADCCPTPRGQVVRNSADCCPTPRGQVVRHSADCCPTPRGQVVHHSALLFHTTRTGCPPQCRFLFHWHRGEDCGIVRHRMLCMKMFPHAASLACMKMIFSCFPHAASLACIKMIFFSCFPRVASLACINTIFFRFSSCSFPRVSHTTRTCCPPQWGLFSH